MGHGILKWGMGGVWDIEIGYGILDLHQLF